VHYGFGFIESLASAVLLSSNDDQGSRSCPYQQEMLEPELIVQFSIEVVCAQAWSGDEAKDYR
jgi:hypothetical protein